MYIMHAPALAANTIQFGMSFQIEEYVASVRAGW